MTDCLIIGAGPYGLSLGAYLRSRNLDFRIVGAVMGAWADNMPEGMYLKSEGFASGLYEPSRSFTLGAYCEAESIPYAHTGIPVSKEIFIGYGQAFQKRFLPGLENRMAIGITRTKIGFLTKFADGGEIASRQVVIAAGVRNYSQRPAAFENLPGTICSHSSDHSDFTQFAGQDLAVIGGGSSAMDVAAALRRCGAHVTVIARRKTVRFQTPLGQRSLRDKIRAPMTALGPGWKSVLCTRAPMVFHHMPDRFRTEIVRRYLGPAPAWFVRDEVEGHVRIVTGTVVADAIEAGGQVLLTTRSEDGGVNTLTVDHVICATGYKVEVGRNTFLNDVMVGAIRDVDGAPKLSRNFETSVPGLYFIGPAAANSFGPVMRFAAGAEFTAQRLSRHLGASRPVGRPGQHAAAQPKEPMPRSFALDA
ncbi:NAD(P)-binding domain-containing protein [Acidisoma cellulosilytica]|uniref:NAD(P)-binding domain-containing protein n=1 Tax=Acidisoma cellulosilyticum TaxID=2802395 RepID=A0A964E4K0_9PROT|nr:NAD(P)-binding domain-containing protein [Acidisoma cellulosilyticum]MCB8881564.1 NAD(P)-binding domain-containing protein [Acidisoma cellulosilyticum]